MTEDYSAEFETRTLSAPPNSPGSKPRLSRFNIILIAAIVISIFFLIRADLERKDVVDELEQTSTELEEVRQTSTQPDTQEVAAAILEQIRRHIVIPDEPAPTVATIVDIDSLKKANSFYDKADNGDYLIITQKRAILYDPDADIVLDVVPVQTGSQTTPVPTPVPTPQPSPSP